MPYIKRQFFGGAITANTQLTLIDVSDLRQVPDTQEVFLYPDSSVSIIVEILQKVESDTSEKAVRFHFDSLAHDNSAQSSQVEAVTELPKSQDDSTPPATVLTGSQTVSKFNRSTLDQVRIHMALYQVKSKDIDLVVTFNVPLVTEDGGSVDGEALKVSLTDFEQFITSLKIEDFGLFT